MRAFVRWIRYDEKNDETMPESGKEYLVSVCLPDSDIKSSETKIACFYTKGSIVTLKTEHSLKERDTETYNRQSAEERLLANIFGGNYETKAEIKDSGFYIITGDEGRNEEEYPDCITIPVRIGEGAEIYYSELPMSPKGYTHPYDCSEAFNEMLAERKARTEEELMENYRSTIDGNEELRGYYDCLGSWKDFKDPETNLYWSRGLCYDINEDKVKRTLALIHTCVLVLGKLNNDYTDEKLSAELKKCGDTLGFVNKMYKKAGIKNENGNGSFSNIRTKLFIMTNIAAKARGISPEYNWFKAFCDETKPFSKETETYRTVYAELMRLLKWRVNRIIMLKDMGAPEIILNNEYRMAFEMAYGYFNKPVCPAKDFSRFYGITPEGDNAEYDPAKTAWFVKDEPDPEYEAECERRIKAGEYEIIRNAVKCKTCGDEIESTDENGEVKCSCGKCIISGGTKKLVRNCGEEEWEDRSILDLGHVPMNK